RLGLRRPDERKQLSRVDPTHRIEIRLLLGDTNLHRLVATLINQPLDDLRLERRLVRRHETPFAAAASSIWWRFKEIPEPSTHSVRPLAFLDRSVAAAADGDLKTKSRVNR